MSPTTAAATCVEDWALAFIRSRDLQEKLQPAPVPSCWNRERRAFDASQLRPGRPPQLVVSERAPKACRSLKSPVARAKLFHRFFHHELQAAELMCWALLRFSDAETDFRAGLIRIALDEIRHMKLYTNEIQRLGFQLGDFPVRDWFWQRTVDCKSPLQFVAFMGMGLEAANLEHSVDYAQQLRALGDERAAAVQRQVGREELHHVQFAVTWFKHWTGDTDFETWRNQLPRPLTPLLMKGRSLERQARARCGMSPAFLDALEQFRPTHRAPKGCSPAKPA